MPRPVIGTSPDPYVRIGGAFGASSNYIIGLRPGTYYQTPCVQRPSFYYQPCNTRTNWLGGYGTYGGYYGSWGGYGGGYTYPYYGTQYSNINYIYSGIL
ncbi:hypothetical protein AYK26_03420 [Euryarchaeota archaeon SM23-78]|nr:MAG: hypothetical protein AYK26_03420 [Euryarchaeota archaeon SM23-78]MBW3001089.1 hypothetical protein [Candidatus Woesearchaeota archaeon]